MGKQSWKPGNMLYPLPAVLVSVADKQGTPNVFTVAWTGTVCSDPPMVSISVRPQRHSYGMILETGEFVINLTTADLAFATDYCGVKSGRDTDKFEEMKSTCKCGNRASVNCRIDPSTNTIISTGSQIECGAEDKYITLCRSCYNKAIAQKLTVNWN